MTSPIIQNITTRDARYRLNPGEGADAIHSVPEYAYAVTRLDTDNKLVGTGLAFTLGPGTDLVCSAIETLAQPIVEGESMLFNIASISRPSCIAMRPEHAPGWIRHKRRNKDEVDHEN